MKEENLTVNMRTLFRTTGSLSYRTQICFAVFLIIMFSVIWFVNSNARLLLKSTNSKNASRKVMLHIKPFSNKPDEFEKIKLLCYNNKTPHTIEDLQKFVDLLKSSRKSICRDYYESFVKIYQIRVKYTSIVISELFMLKMKKWLNNDQKLIQAAKNQSLIFVDNLYSQESVVFNPVRANRPGVSAGDTKIYVEKIIKDSLHGCDFCNYQKYTASDDFGYMESKYAVVISNSFKIERYHGMALFRSHDPIHFTQLQYIDTINLALKWFRRTNELVPGHQYRVMYWDVLPKASASQIHPHFHLTLGDYAYYAKWNILYKAGLMFSKHHTQRNYWKTVLEVHSALGLTVSFGQASVLAYITPQKDFEVIVISQKPCLDFFRLVYFTIRTFIDNMEQYSLSMGFVFPKMHTDYTKGDELPMMVRIVSRGAADSARSDISSFDLFGTANVNKDPFKVIRKIRELVEVKQKEEFSYPEWEQFE